MTPLELRTARLLLRDFREGDVERVYEYQKHYDGATPTYEDVERLVELFRSWAMESPRTRYQLAITRDSYLIGTCGVRGNQNHEAEFGCELDPRFWKQGFAYEASSRLLAFVQNEMQFDRVVARTQPANRAAIRLAQQLGFEWTEDGLLVLRSVS